MLHRNLKQTTSETCIKLIHILIVSNCNSMYHIITIVFNNQSFANVRRDQMERFDGRLVGAEFDNPDFVKLADAFGVEGIRVTSPQQLKPVLNTALKNDKPVVIEVMGARGSEVSPWEFIAQY